VTPGPDHQTAGYPANLEFHSFGANVVFATVSDMVVRHRRIPRAGDLRFASPRQMRVAAHRHGPGDL